VDKRLNMPNFICKFDITHLLNNGDIAQNTIYLKRQDCAVLPANIEFTSGFADTLAGNIATAWAAHMAPVISQDVTTESIKWAWNEVPGVGPVHSGEHFGAPLPISGAVGVESMPNGVAKAMRFRTGLAGRAHHGRIFLPGVPRSFGTTDKADLLTPAAQAAYVAAGSSFLAAVNGNNCVLLVGDTWYLTVVSFETHDVNRVPAIETRVTAIDISDAFVDYQRRRSLGHSRHG
jgi:hypothetical protein